MRFAGKMATLIKATLRMPTHLFSKPEDAQARLTALEKELADIEAKEQSLANLLKATQAKAKEADAAGDTTEADAQMRLAQKLETQLDTQSVQAITLSENVKVLSQALASSPSGAVEKQTSATDAPPASASPDMDDVSENDDLTARKSRLSD